MLVDIDDSHPELGSDKGLMAVVVGLVDGRLNQYCTHLSTQKSREEIVQQLEGVMVTLFAIFRQRNRGKMPQNVKFYHDGVRKSQFEAIFEKELLRISGALECIGTPEVDVKVVCSLPWTSSCHHTRSMCEEQDDTRVFINPCPGLLVDDLGQQDANIISSKHNKFYLNSHATI